MTDVFSFLNEENEDQAAPEVAEQPVEPAPQEVDATANRDEKGRFAPKSEPVAEEPPQPQPESVQEAPQAPQAPQVPPGYVPLAALEDERRKAREARQRLQEFEAMRANPPPAPDDPEYLSYVQQTLRQEQYNRDLKWSQRFAEKEHGKEVVDQAFEWGEALCNEDPLFNQKVAMSGDPYGFVVAEWKKQQILSRVQDPSEYDAFLAWKAQQGAQPQPAPSQAQSQPAPQAPRPSIAGMPSSGGPLTSAPPVDLNEAFKGAFK